MLARLRTSQDDQDRGFTLIELLVVIIIIGILAAIAIPTFLNQRKKGWVSAIKSDLHNASIAEESYATENSGAYTATSPIPGLNASDGVTITPSLIAGGYQLVGTNTAFSGCSITFTSTTGVSTPSGCS